MVYLLNDAKFDGVQNLSLLKTEYLKPSIDLDSVNNIIVTSKKALYALDALGSEWKAKHIFTVGEATAAMVRELGGKVYHTAQGYGEDLAKDIIRHYSFGNYLYCRGKEVATDVGALLRRSNIAAVDAVLYATQCDSKIETDIPDGSIIIFTSPKTVRCFFRTWKWQESWQAVCIGKTTKNAMPRDIQVLMPKNPSFEEAVALAKGLEN